MCHVNTGANWDRPIQRTDLEWVVNYYPVSEELIEDIWEVILTDNSPQPIVLVALVDLAYRYQNKLVGDKYPWVTLPFSALLDDPGTIQPIRVMAPQMSPFHGIFGMFALASSTVDLLKEMLHDKWQLSFDFFCDCGCIMTDPPNLHRSTQFFKDLNLVRGDAEAHGGGMEIAPFEDPLWKDSRLDMGWAEIEAYQRMQECIQGLAEYDSLDLVKKDFVTDARRSLREVRQSMNRQLVTV